jgi:hypothetical protein
MYCSNSPCAAILRSVVIVLSTTRHACCTRVYDAPRSVVMATAYRYIKNTGPEIFDKSWRLILYIIFLFIFHGENYHTRFVYKFLLINFVLFRINTLHCVWLQTDIQLLRLYMLQTFYAFCDVYIRQIQHKVRCMIRSRAITPRRVMPLTYSILRGWRWRVSLPHGVNKWVYYGRKDGVFSADV